MAIRPVLRFGSINESVLLLQKALNLAPTAQAPLAEDSNFGSKTRSRVVEFQTRQNISADGIVGEMTWGVLEPFLAELAKLVSANAPKAVNEDELRDKIVAVTESALLTFGWGSAPVVPDGSPRIAAARGCGPVMGMRRARQGGASLASIYSFARDARASLCLALSTERFPLKSVTDGPSVPPQAFTMEEVYQLDPAKYLGRRDLLNKKDIGSWCGIFATYCYRMAGLGVNWSQVKAQSRDLFDIVLPGAAVRRGDIGVYSVFNHHFVVVEDAAAGSKIQSIDGNVSNPSEAVVSPWNSVIGRRTYLRETLKNQNGRFLRPKFAALVAAK